MSECLLYYLKDGLTKVGQPSQSDIQPDIQLSGAHILNHHCTFCNRDGNLWLQICCSDNVVIQMMSVLNCNEFIAA